MRENIAVFKEVGAEFGTITEELVRQGFTHRQVKHVKTLFA